VVQRIVKVEGGKSVARRTGRCLTLQEFVTLYIRHGMFTQGQTHLNLFRRKASINELLPFQTLHVWANRIRGTTKTIIDIKKDVNLLSGATNRKVPLRRGKVRRQADRGMPHLARIRGTTKTIIDIKKRCNPIKWCHE
jgi:hypothetical protein